MDAAVPLHHSKWGLIGINVAVKEKKPINFSFSDRHLSINSDQGIIVTIGGIPVKIKSIDYHEATGKFKVKTDTFLGIGEQSLNDAIAKKLNDLFRPKVTRAFKELKSLRSKKSLHELSSVVNTISNIFSTGKPLPGIKGDVELVFYPEKDQKLKIDQWKAEVKGHDRISAGVKFYRKNNRIKINEVSFNSYSGIRLYGQTKFPEIASLNFKNLVIDGRGTKFNYDIGAEEVLTGFKLLVGIIGQYSGRTNILNECDPVKLEYIRNSIDGNLKREIAQVIKLHRPTLLNAGISKELLAALD